MSLFALLVYGGQYDGHPLVSSAAPMRFSLQGVASG